MKTDVAGRVKNTSLAASRPLLPLYEAVVNSVEAIQDAENKKGRIEITILRDTQHLLNEQDPSLGDITGFEITDTALVLTKRTMRLSRHPTRHMRLSAAAKE